VPKKIRELLKELKMAGFIDRGGKGSHRNFMHPSGVALTVSGQLGNDAKFYQIKLVREKIEDTLK
jgi:predicted RNA binding protein YcfA (HicA-like mRNA interferase family)